MATAEAADLVGSSLLLVCFWTTRPQPPQLQPQLIGICSLFTWPLHDEQMNSLVIIIIIIAGAIVAANKGARYHYGLPHCKQRTKYIGMGQRIYVTRLFCASKFGPQTRDSVPMLRNSISECKFRFQAFGFLFVFVLVDACCA